MAEHIHLAIFKDSSGGYTKFYVNIGREYCHDPGRDKATRIRLTQKGNLAKVT